MAERDDSTTPGWEQARKDADLTLWLSDTVPVFFRKIVCPPEGFWMGSRGFDPSEEPMHRVRLKPFYISTFPVTQEQWAAVVTRLNLKGLKKEPSEFKGRLRPVEQVTWNDATAWCEALKQGWRSLAPKKNATLAIGDLRLPWEAEWEFACKGEAWHTEYANGDGEARLASIGWYDENSKGETHAVGKLDANEHKLYDMHGNVWEWCEDLYDERAYCKRRDGWEAACWTESSDHAERRVVRGGSWSDFAGWLRSAYRYAFAPGYRVQLLGFRFCLRSPEPSGRSPKSSGAQAGTAATGAAADAARPFAKGTAGAVSRGRERAKRASAAKSESSPTEER